METSAPELALASSSHGFPMIDVVGDSFCVPYPTEITVKKKYHGFFLNQRYEVLDANGNVLLQVDGSSLNMQKKRIMRDAAGSPILTMREKVKLLTLRHRWMVHRGRSSEQKDFIFGVQRSHPLDMTPRLDVFMASNINVNGDISSSFQLVGSHIDNSCKVYNGDTMIAETNREAVYTASKKLNIMCAVQVVNVFPRSNFSKWKEIFRVKINAGVDYAFIVALLVILTVNDYI